MIKHKEPLSMTESLEYIEEQKDGEGEADIRKLIKKFIKLKPEEAKKMRDKLDALGLIKLKPEYIAKVIDIMPEDQESINKIFTDVSLDEDETKKILDALAEFK